MAHKKNKISISCYYYYCCFITIFYYILSLHLFPAYLYNTKHNIKGGKKLHCSFFPINYWTVVASWFNPCISDSGLLIFCFCSHYSHSSQSVPTKESTEDITHFIGEASDPSEEASE